MQSMNCLFRARDPSRAVIAISGKGVKDFLQGLYTNDVAGADTSSERPPLSRGTSQYGCFLSGTGRTLFDGFVTDISLVPSEAEVAAAEAAKASAPKPTVSSGSSGGALSAPPPPTGFSNEMVLVDVAANVRELAMQHFRDFKLRRKIKITDVTSHVGVYVETIRTAPACASPSAQTKIMERLKRTVVDEEAEEDANLIETAAEAVARRFVETQQAAVDEALVACDADPSSPLMVLDPRYSTAVEGTLGDFSEPPEDAAEPLPPPLPMVLRRGYRVLTTRSSAAQNTPASSGGEQEGKEIAAAEEETKMNVDGLRAYRALVESLCGVPANSRVFLPNKGLPFEGNIDQLWGVSFEKGCYLGQELTHRTHVMLVCRKRVVPIVLGHFDSREDILRIAGGFSDSISLRREGEGNGCCGSALCFDVDDLTLSGIDFTTPRGTVWGTALIQQDVEHILPLSTTTEGPTKATPTPQNRATNPANAIGNRLYVLTTEDSDDQGSSDHAAPDPSKLTAVGHVTQGQYNVGAGLVRLRYMNPKTRTMKLYIKRSEQNVDIDGEGAAVNLPQYVPATAFIPLWWAEEVIEKVLSSSEPEE